MRPTAIRLKEGENLFRLLAVAVSAYRVFSSSHPRFLDGCRGFLDAVDDFFSAHPEQQNLLFVQRGGRMYFRGVPMSILTPPAIRFADLLREKSLEGLRIGRESNLTALTCAVGALFSVAAEEPEPLWKTINRVLENDGVKERLGFFADRELAGLSEVACDTVDEASPENGSALFDLPLLEMPLELYKNTLVALHDLMSMLGAGGNPKFDTLIDISRRITSGVIEGDQEFLHLTSVSYSDEFTFNHSVNVCLLVTAASKPFAKDPEWLIRIGQAALLHDLGKSFVPQEILYREGALGDDEKEEIERHCRLGAEILQDSSGIDPLSVVVAYDHHRRPGGGGYPLRRRDRPLDVLTSLVAAADILEALIAERPYKRGLSPAEAFEVFGRLPQARGLETGVRLLLSALSPYPPGTFVELSTGEYALVTRARPGAPTTPLVRLISTRGGRRRIEPEDVDLAASDPGGAAPPRIARALPARWWNATEEEPEARQGEPPELQRRISDGTLLASEG